MAQRLAAVPWGAVLSAARSRTVSLSTIKKLPRLVHMDCRSTEFSDFQSLLRDASGFILIPAGVDSLGQRDHRAQLQIPIFKLARNAQSFAGCRDQYRSAAGVLLASCPCGVPTLPLLRQCGVVYQEESEAMSLEPYPQPQR